MQRPRITTRRMMLLVATCALLLGGEVCRRRTVRWMNHVNERLAYHTRWEEDSGRTSDTARRNAESYEEMLRARDLPEERREQLLHYLK